ncbi:MAG: hypothetical protein MUF29_03350 [Chitinophagaceae bacterium]|jgi:hypothetical protein|nr:hypothetical protein [Chitinophagaceae bacterium]
MGHFRIITLVTAMILGTGMVKAQSSYSGKRALELKLGYGIAPVQNMNDDFSTSLVPDLADPGYVSLKKDGSGMFSAGLRYQTASRFGFGLDMVYGKTTTEYVYNTTLISKTVESQWFTLMARASYTYYLNEINLPHVELYGAVAAGSSFRDARNEDGKTLNSSHLAYQITPLGVRSGRKIAIWAELGYGFKGLVNAGLSWKW